MATHGARIRRERNLRSLDQKQFAAQVTNADGETLSVRTLSRIEHGLSESSAWIPRIQEQYGISFEPTPHPSRLEVTLAAATNMQLIEELMRRELSAGR